MKLLTNLFKPKWKNKQASIRKQTISTFQASDSEQNDILLQLAKNDPDTDVRQVAISKLIDASALNEISNDSNETIQQSALVRLANLLMGKIVKGPTPNQRSQLIQDLKNNTQLLLKICLCSDDLDFNIMITDLISDDKILASIAVESTLTKVRQHAIAKIDHTDVLALILKQSKNRDKRVTQIAKDKLSQLKLSQEEQSNQLQECENIYLNIKSLSTSAYNPLYSSKLLHLKTQWASMVREAPLHLVSKFEQAVNTCEDVISHHQAAEIEIEEKQARKVISHEEQLATCDTLEQCVSDLKQEISTDLNATSIESLLAIQHRRWQEATDNIRPHPKELMRYNKSTELLDNTQRAIQAIAEHNSKIKEAIDNQENESLEGLEANNQRLKHTTQLLSTIAWPNEIAKPEAVRSLETVCTESQKKITALKASESDNIQTLKNTIKKFAKAIDDGNIDSANTLNKEVKKKLGNISQTEQKELEHKIHLLSNQLHELQDWRGFATHPKKEELCVAMETLKDTDISPKEKADAIKDLQTQWKNLGSTRSNEERALWNRFKDASDIAYEPCKAYFSDLQGHRQYNLEQREIICEQLESFLNGNDWENPNWKAVDKIVHTSKKEWQQFSPVDRTKIKAIQNRFNAVIQPLTAKINTEKDSNIQTKQSLVDEAKELLELDDIQEAINLSKGLQRKWQAIGVDHRAKGQALWREYRGLCDKVFLRQKEELKASEQDQQNNMVVASQINDKILELANSADTELASSRSKFNELSEAFSNVGALPQKARNDIFKKNKAASSLYHERISGIGTRTAMASFVELERRADLCELLEQNPIAATLTSIETQWTGDHNLPPSSESRIDARFESAKALLNTSDAIESEKTDEAKRLLCIRLEILAGIESPQSDEKLRMSYQVNRLSKGIGQGNSVNENEVNDIRIDWCCTESTENSGTSLKERYKKAVDTLAC